MTAPVSGVHDAREKLRLLVRAEVRESGWTQADVARKVGITPKHLSRMLVGHERMSVTLAAAILFVVGRRLAFGTAPLGYDQVDEAR